jgi:hypothetical protein
MKIVFETEYEKFQFERILDNICVSTELDKNKFDVDIVDLIVKLIGSVIKADTYIENKDYAPYAGADADKTTALALSPTLYYNKNNSANNSELLK